ncbi:MFS transporter [Gorillibacterium timonense]|uniref:MFS transporter n=1 Tax=Gorillibacterium timonense TaxID=1689269 RepID=UPI00071C5A20|nr:MFS transporter [Gorillibacterium timonense]
MEKIKRGKLPVVFESTIELPSSRRSSRQTEADDENSGSEEEGSSKKRNPSSRNQLREFLAIATVPLVLVLGNSILVPILPQMVRELGISKAQSSLVITLFSVTAGLVIPIAGFLSDRFSRKSVILPALILFGAAGVLAGFGAVWKSYTVIIIARAFQGVGAAGTSSIAMALVGDMYSGATESRALGLTEASNGTGKVISPILGAALALLVWYAPFFAFPVFCLMSILAVSLLIKEPKKEKAPPRFRDYLQANLKILKSKGKWLIPAFFAGSLGLFILFGVLFYLSNILEEPPYAINGIIKGLVLAIPLLGMVVTSYTTGANIKKNGLLMRKLMLTAMFGMVVSLGLAVFFHKTMIVFIGLLTLNSIGIGLLLPCLNTMITGSVEKEERGMITSLYNSLRYLGVAAGPPLFSWMMDKSDRLVFITVSALALIALGLVFFLIKPSAEVA